MLGKKSTAKQVVEHFAVDLKGKFAIVTGGGSGLGLQTSKALAYGGCRVLIGVRHPEDAQQAIEKEIKIEGQSGYAVPQAQVMAKRLDLSDLKSIKAFAEDVLANEARIDFLILNAGIMACPKSYTKDGFETQIGTNYIGHWYLSQLLLPRMKAQAFPSRIVAVSSIAHWAGYINLEDLHYKKGRFYVAWLAYGQSKLANILLIKQLAEVVKDTNIRAFSIHPGVMKTPAEHFLYWPSRWLINSLIVDKTPAQGAATMLFACLSPQLEQHNGAYLSDCQVARTSSYGEDRPLREKLWAVTANQVQTALSASSQRS